MPHASRLAGPEVFAVHEYQSEWPPGAGSPPCGVASADRAFDVFVSLGDRRRIGEVVVGRRPVEVEGDRADRAALAVDGDPVDGARRRGEDDAAARRAFAAGVVVARDFGQRADRAAGVDAEQGVDPAAAGVEGEFAVVRRGPLEPDRVAAADARDLRLARLHGREAVGARGEVRARSRRASRGGRSRRWPAALRSRGWSSRPSLPCRRPRSNTSSRRRRRLRRRCRWGCSLRVGAGGRRRRSPLRSAR